MPVLLRNVVFDTVRPVRNTTTGITRVNPNGLYLSGIEGHMEPNRVGRLVPVSDAAVSAPYKLQVDTGTDIAQGDSIVNITRIQNGQPYPGDMQETNVSWSVVHVTETSPVLLECRTVYLDRITGGGPTHV
jgi:hypothetical protein